MQPDERKKLGKDMYDVANEMVGNVGPDIDSAFIFARHTKDKPKVSSDMPCDIAQFCLRRVSPEYAEIMDVWTKWIRAYYDFKKIHHPEYLELLDDPDLIVRWLQRPVIDPDRWLEKLNIENPSFVLVRAYLIIYRVDCYASETKENILSGMSADKT